VPGLPPKTIRAALLAVGAAAVLAGCGSDDAGTSGTSELVPPDAPLYLEVALFPDDGRTESLASLTDRIAGISDPKGQLTAMLDAELASEGTGLGYSEDIEPWLGETAAAFVRSFEPADAAAGMIDAAYLLSVTDTGAAQDFIDKLAESDPDATQEEREYEGGTYVVDPVSRTAVGLVGETMVVGTEPAFKSAVDASNGDSLADAEDFSDEVGSLDDEALAEVWIDLGTALDAASTSPGVDPAEIDAARAALEPLLAEPIAASLEVEEDSVALETSAAGGAGIAGNTELLQQMPAGSWFAVAIEDAGEALQESLAGIGTLGAQLGDPTLDPDAIAGIVQSQTGLDLEDDLLSWIGNAAFFVSGTGEAEFRAGGLLETSDPAAATNALDAARDSFEQQAGVKSEPPRLEGATEGFSATSPGGEASVEVSLRDDLVVGAFGGPDPATELVESGEPLTDDERFSAAKDALGGDFAATIYVAMQDFLIVAEKGDDGDTDYDAARPYTEALDYLILGTAQEDDRERARIVLGVAE